MTLYQPQFKEKREKKKKDLLSIFFCASVTSVQVEKTIFKHLSRIKKKKKKAFTPCHHHHLFFVGFL